MKTFSTQQRKIAKRREIFALIHGFGMLKDDQLELVNRLRAERAAVIARREAKKNARIAVGR